MTKIKAELFIYTSY